MSDAPVTTTVEGAVLVATLNRPAQKNSIDTALTSALITALQELDERSDLRVGVLTGAGGTFCAGMDLKAFAKEGSPRGIFRLYQDGCRKPLVAAVEGVALGGGLELALTADLIVAARDAILGTPEVKVGLFAGGGALLRLPAAMPQRMAMEFALTGRRISAEEGFRLGLVNRVVEPGHSREAAMSLAEEIAENAPLALMATKDLIRRGQGMTEAEFWQAQRSVADEVFNSKDAREGAKAFAERRAPRWTGS